MITIIFSALNEGDEPLNTIKSIYETADPKDFKIIVFDDGSFPKLEIPKKYKEVRVVRNNMRIGVAGNFDKGVELARTPFVFLCNARMRFKPGWIEEGVKWLKKEPETIFCTTSLCLTYDNTDIDKCEIKRYGAEIIFSRKDKKYGIQILEPSWLKEKDKDVYEVPCVLGANYFITKKWYQHIKGFEGLATYGGMCAYLSLKSWMAGGKCKILKKIEIGNIYRDPKLYKEKLKPNYLFIEEDKLWNKLFTAFTLLSQGEATELLCKLRPKAHYTLLVNRLQHFAAQIKEYRDYYKSINKINAINFIRR